MEIYFEHPLVDEINFTVSPILKPDLLPHLRHTQRKVMQGQSRMLLIPPSPPQQVQICVPDVLVFAHEFCVRITCNT